MLVGELALAPRKRPTVRGEAERSCSHRGREKRLACDSGCVLVAMGVRSQAGRARAYQYQSVLTDRVGRHDQRGLVHPDANERMWVVGPVAFADLESGEGLARSEGVVERDWLVLAAHGRSRHADRMAE